MALWDGEFTHITAGGGQNYSDGQQLVYALQANSPASSLLASRLVYLPLSALSRFAAPAARWGPGPRIQPFSRWGSWCLRSEPFPGASARRFPSWSVQRIRNKSQRTQKETWRWTEHTLQENQIQHRIALSVATLRRYRKNIADRRCSK